jgi:peptide/nickel transport system permease protein
MAILFLKHLGRALAVLVAVTFATFCLMYGNAEGIAQTVLGLNAQPEDVQNQVVKLGLDKPLIVQYWDWLTSALSGDLGNSFYTSESVTGALSNRLPVTLSVTVFVFLLTAVASVLLGVTAAVRGGRVDKFVQFFSVLGTAIPAFIVAIFLVFTFAIHWRLLPATGYVALQDDPSLWLKSIALPVIALLVGAVAGAAAQFRTAILDTLGRDFVRTLRARGINEREVVFRHVLRNSAGPGLTVLSLQLIYILGGAVFIELIFALPGMGDLANTAAQVNDIPMVMGCVLVTIIIVLTVNILADLAIMILNPKARS